MAGAGTLSIPPEVNSKAACLCAGAIELYLLRLTEPRVEREHVQVVEKRDCVCDLFCKVSGPAWLLVL